LESAKHMSYTKESAISEAKKDLARRLGIGTSEIAEAVVLDRDFPDTSLGAATADEMSAQMISSGWQITLSADGKDYEYRADKNQLRLHNYNGSNYVIA
jgi:hypothetical protein